MNRIFEHARSLTRCAWAPALVAMVLGVTAGSASATTLGVQPKGNISDPFAINDGIGGIDVPIVDPDPNTPAIPIGVRGHSDVPDLPDSTGGNSGSNLGIYQPMMPIPGGPGWLPQGPVDDFGTVDFAPGGDGTLVWAPTTSPVPAPSGIVALGVAAVATAARRRR